MLKQPRTQEDVSVEERTYVSTRMVQYDAEQAHGTMKLGTFYNAAVMIAVLWLAPPMYHPYFYADAGTSFVVGVLYVLGLHRLRLARADVLVFVLNLFHITAFSYCVGLAMTTHDADSMIKVACSLTALTPILIILSPFSGVLSPIMAATFWVLSAAVMPWLPMAFQWLVIYAITVGFSTAVRFRASASLRRQMLLEYRARQSEVRAASAKLQRDLELAREIQDSMAPTEISETPEGLSVHCVQQKFEKVAGDWMTTRRWADGTFLMMIADATGKGMQAALVVHAIQSLWATAMDDDEFDPQGWLERLNRALRRLGEKQPHSATVGIATLKGNRLSYWSAGHLPLFLLLGAGPKLTYKTLSSRGNVLGLGADLALKVQYIDVMPTHPLRIILASDGVLEHGSMTPRSEVIGLYDGMKSMGASILATLPAADDKTLIIVERNVPIAEGRKSA